jgi:hypothetical protein
MSEPAPANPSDVIVGSWRLPTPIRRVPALVWVFAAAAVVDAVLRTTSSFPGESGNPLLVIPMLISNLPTAGLLFMPGAVLLGRWSAFAGRAAMAGAILLAASELIALALRLVPFESIDSAASSDAATFGQTLAPVRAVAVLLSLAGLVFLLWAAVAARTGTAGARVRVVAGALIAVAVASAMEGVWVLLASAQPPPPDENGLSITAPDLASAAISIAAGVVWGLLAAVATLGASAARDRRLGWTALAAGAALVVVTRATWDVINAGVMLRLITPSLDGPYLVLLRVSETLYPIATALVLIALTVGLTDRRARPPLHREHEPQRRVPAS